ncbi:MAG: hypothetical protein PUP93_34625, partial [Rhizonema sp. NSF051]|nr:hypothetical protein [Rhizonema sp. NSF051]
VSKSKADITIKSRVSAWLKEFEQNILVGGSLLGLENLAADSQQEAGDILTGAEEKTLLNV